MTSITPNSSAIIQFNRPNNTIRQGGEIAEPTPKPALPYRWFRFENDAINDPRVLRLSASLRWVWVSLLCVSSKYDGQLPPIKDIAIMIRMEPKKLDAAINILLASGLLDENQGVIKPADWDRLQCKSDADPTNAERQKRFRDKSNALRNAPVTRYGNDTVHNTTDRTEQNRQNTTEQNTEADLSKRDAANGVCGVRGVRKEEIKQAAIKPQAALNLAAPVRAAPPSSAAPPPSVRPSSRPPRLTRLRVKRTGITA
jgi:hypothetical protein